MTKDDFIKKLICIAAVLVVINVILTVILRILSN